jgi:AbrB family looped-hinge helix DNA binding protein
VAEGNTTNSKSKRTAERKTMKITSKGQVTIPADVRREAGLLPGSEVEFIMEDGKVVIRKAAGSAERGRSLVRAMRGKGEVEMTTDEIMALTRGEE